MENSAFTSLKFDKSPYHITLSYADFSILVKVVPMSLKKIGIKRFTILFYMRYAVIFVFFNFVKIASVKMMLEFSKKC